ncbi:hypothetical protein HID58_093527, partial [Brassica napus]
WPAWSNHLTNVEWFDGRTTRRSSSGLLGSSSRRSLTGSMVGPLDVRRVACLGRPLDDRRVVRWSEHSTIFEWSAPTIFEWPAWADHSTIAEWFDARTVRRVSCGSMVLLLEWFDTVRRVVWVDGSFARIVRCSLVDLSFPFEHFLWAFRR